MMSLKENPTPKVEELVSEPNLKNSIASMGIQNEVEKAQEISNEIDTEELKIEKPKTKKRQTKKKLGLNPLNDAFLG